MTITTMDLGLLTANVPNSMTWPLKPFHAVALSRMAVGGAGMAGTLLTASDTACTAGTAPAATGAALDRIIAERAGYTIGVDMAIPGTDKSVEHTLDDLLAIPPRDMLGTNDSGNHPLPTTGEYA